MPTASTLAKNLPADHRVVLDWLARAPCRVYDFAELADALKMKRGAVEQVLRDLQHQRFGSVLKLRAPDGLPLRSRHAFLPHDSAARVGYPACAPPDMTAKEHPTVRQIRLNREAAAKAGAEAAEALRIAGATRQQTHVAYTKAKVEAREKARQTRPDTKKGRNVTGYAMPVEPLGPPVAPSSLLASQPVLERAPPVAESPVAIPTTKKPAYKKATPANDSPAPKEPTA
jgi:hypothetical protein